MILDVTAGLWLMIGEMIRFHTDGAYAISAAEHGCTWIMPQATGTALQLCGAH
jgi:hypothetical protein